MNELDQRERIQLHKATCKKEYLTIEVNFKILMATRVQLPPRGQGGFIFPRACFTGLRLSDIKRLAPMHIFKTADLKGLIYIDMEMQKITEKFSIRLPLSRIG